MMDDVCDRTECSSTISLSSILFFCPVLLPAPPFLSFVSSRRDFTQLSIAYVREKRMRKTCHSRIHETQPLQRDWDSMGALLSTPLDTLETLGVNCCRDC